MIMTVVRLKAKNQITLPVQIIKRLHLREDELFQVDIEGNYIRLIPVDVKPRYTKKDLEKINKLVRKERKKAKSIKAGSEFSSYIDNIK